MKSDRILIIFLILIKCYTENKRNNKETYKKKKWSDALVESWSRLSPRRRALPSPPPIPAVRAHLGFAESPEVHRQVGLNAIHGSGQGDSAEQQHSQDHIGHRGCDPHNLERSQKVHARKGKKNNLKPESHTSCTHPWEQM